MTSMNFTELLGEGTGRTTPNAYNSAWVARVPSATDVNQPAWPQALAFLRRNQLKDGGWGECYSYYAHERTISTLAALLALLEWGESPASQRIQRGVAALYQYATDLPTEPHEPIGFELLLPRIGVAVESFDIDLPRWPGVERMAKQKAALIGQLVPDYDAPRSWWFNMEMMLPYQLENLDQRILTPHGSIAISPAATAAYLRALRLKGKDSPRAAAFLNRVLAFSGGGAGVCYPIEGFEVIWTLDNYRRAGVEPNRSALAPLIRWLADYWESSDNGVSHSRVFPVPDGDDTAVAYKVLCWAGQNPSDKPLMRFWNEERHHFLTYLDERTPSVSAAVHALSAFRHDETNPVHREIAADLTSWLGEQMEEAGALYDKWHWSPLYATTRVVPPLVGWDDDLARQCMAFVLEEQREDGGWGNSERSNLEETSMAILSLVAANRGGLLESDRPLRRAAAYMKEQASAEPTEQLWIGKALYRPIGVVDSLLSAARAALEIEGLDHGRPQHSLRSTSR
ncbi:MAG: prenyltransferase/squalene oxidase repeat-containing protein [Candidatus Promineifilaceae bacterium]|nr:prenyltransferase/squalene oxidase repeat-containing protein [Candidatus Promineifilaceae bacterium]